MMLEAGKRSRSPFFYLLLATCLLVWGFVMYQVFVGLMGVPDEEEMAASELATTMPVRTPEQTQPIPPYEGGFKDPFVVPTTLFASEEITEIRVDTQRVVLPPAPPPFRLLGIVNEMAILQAPEGSVHVVGVKDEIGDVTVEVVQYDHVVLHFQARPFILKIDS